MKALVFACVVAAFCVEATLQDTPHTPCSKGPMPKALRVEGCTNTPCNFYRGTNLRAQWDFVAVADAEQLSPSVTVQVVGIPITINYTYPEPDACKSLVKGECPVEKGDELTYDLNMPISPQYPSVTLIIEFSLKDENENAQVCFKLEGKVVDAKTLSYRIAKDRAFHGP